MSRRAVILCGGKGIRLKPYTVVLPKPLMPVGDYPILEIIVRQLVQSGFDHITMAIGHQADLIKAFFANGSKWNIKIDYSMEDSALSTIAPLRLINDLSEDFLIMNGDILTDLCYKDFFDCHIRDSRLFTISSFVLAQRFEYGVLEVNSDNALVGFKEKPTEKYEVSMGIYMANKRILEFIPEDKPYGFDALMRDLIKANRPPAIFRHSGSWMDIGNPEDYARALKEFEQKQNLFLGAD